MSESARDTNKALLEQFRRDEGDSTLFDEYFGMVFRENVSPDLLGKVVTVLRCGVPLYEKDFAGDDDVRAVAWDRYCRLMSCCGMECRSQAGKAERFAFELHKLADRIYDNPRADYVTPFRELAERLMLGN